MVFVLPKATTDADAVTQNIAEIGSTPTCCASDVDITFAGNLERAISEVKSTVVISIDLDINRRRLLQTLALKQTK